MDPALLLMLSSLMQLENSFESSSSSSSFSSSSINDNNAPLLFFMLAAVLSHAAAIYSHNNSNPGNTDSYFNNNVNSLHSNLITDQMWALDPQVRDSQWRSTYGLSYPLFTKLVELIRPHIPVETISMPLNSALAMVLYRLSQGFNAKTLASQYNIDPWMIAKITNMITRVLSTKLYSNYIRIPSGQRLLQIIQGFKDLTGLPNMCGAIDGSHVKIHKRPSNEFIYKCRHHFVAVLLQAVSDHRKVFWDICVRAPGGTDDSTHFRESTLFNKLLSGQVLMDAVVTIRGIHIRPYLVGDWCYPLLSYLVRPFSSNGSGTPAENAFDASLMRGRSSVEQAIGLLKGRWRILQDLNVGLNHAPQTIVACCVLHNMCQMAEEPEPDMWKDPKENGPVARLLDSEKSLHYFGECLRQALLEDLQDRQRVSTR
eukprot:Gb_19400 [translate_table: standard]